MVECMRTAARDSKTERIKVSCLDIIITMIGKKPYYEIKYKEIGEDYYHVGYSSYKLENVLAWKDECFEIVKECRPQTNADRIRSMTDEELAKWFDAVTKDILGGSTWDKNAWVTSTPGAVDRECLDDFDTKHFYVVGNIFDNPEEV